MVPHDAVTIRMNIMLIMFHFENSVVNVYLKQKTSACVVPCST